VQRELEQERIRQERVRALEKARREAEEKAATATAAAAAATAVATAAATAAKKQEEERERQAKEQLRQAEKQKETAISVPPKISSSTTTDPCEGEFESHLATIEVRSVYKNMHALANHSSQSSQMFSRLVQRTRHGRRLVLN